MKRKRQRQSEALAGGTDTSRPPKRKRNIVIEAPTAEEIHSTRQLAGLLKFEQDLTKSRHALQSFKNLLDGLFDEAGRPDESKKQIVIDFLQLTKPDETDRDDAPIYLPDIMEAWGMAASMGNENIMSASAVVLALLLKFISDHVDLVPYGIGIGRTLLLRQHQDLIARNLSADKGKDFVISPTLRLVRELVCIDGGTLAAPAFRARNAIIKSLGRNMGLRFIGDGVESPQRPSVRTNAVRMFLSLLKFVHVEAKKDLLFQKDVVAALMRHLQEDPPFLVLEVLKMLRSTVILDQKLPKEAKIRLLNAQSLTRIASLYFYQQDELTDGQESVEQAAHQFLLAACTSNVSGIIRPQHGLYPEGVDPDSTFSGIDEDGCGLETIPWMEKFDEDVPVRNTLLAEFIQTLRPWSNSKQNELLVAIFAACPELVCNYFLNKRSFGFEPKLSATWIGYSTLIFDIILLKIPEHFGHRDGFAKLPPPVSTVLGHIIPLPLDAKTMSRCFTMKVKLISFFALRFLVIALEKLSTVLKLYRKASIESGPIWKEASRRLIDEFCRRMPNFKTVIGTYRTLPEDDSLQRSAASQVLLLYHEVIPQVALSAKFDYAPLLLDAIKRVQGNAGGSENKAMQMMELENLFAMARYSPSIKWFGKTKGMQNSTFMTLLRLYANNADSLASGKLFLTVLEFAMEESGLVHRQSASAGLKPLLSGLKDLNQADAGIWDFLDNCAERCARTPIKYQEMILELAAKHLVSEDEDIEKTSLSPLTMAIVEQLPFLFSSSNDKSLHDAVARFLSVYLACNRSMGANEKLLAEIHKQCAENFGGSEARSHLLLSNPLHFEAMEVYEDKNEESIPKQISPTKAAKLSISQDQLKDLLSVPFTTSPKSSNNALTKWMSKTKEELVEEEHAASVIWLLASPHQSIRKEALINISKMAAKFKEDTAYEEHEQVWLLLSELFESVRTSSTTSLDTTPVPATILAFATRALGVLAKPTHVLYPKVNHFLTRGPAWRLDKIPLARDVLSDGPSVDDARYTELAWLLAYILDALRSPADAALLARRSDSGGRIGATSIWERLLALFNNPYLGRGLRMQVLRLLYRATELKGVSTMLVTRLGVAGWFIAQGSGSNGSYHYRGGDSNKEGWGAVGEGDFAPIFKALLERLWATCDQTRVAEWNRGGLQCWVRDGSGDAEKD